MSDMHRHSSWGRTRRLKNVTGADGAALNTSDSLPTEVDIVRTISNASRTGHVLTLTIANDSTIVAGDVIYVSGNASLKNRAYVVASRPNGTTITIDLPQDLRNITPTSGGSIRRRTTAGYSTENQRFLHLITGSTGTVAKVWAYSYATGIWSELKLPARDTKGAAANDDESVELSVTVGSGTHRVVEIAGIDRLAFKITNTVYAATSTF
tara:strand:+ start:97 stop:726 length:630 start_codon:yes stop_codon:yes gene_type:complete